MPEELSEDAMQSVASMITRVRRHLAICELLPSLQSQVTSLETEKSELNVTPEEIDKYQSIQRLIGA